MASASFVKPSQTLYVRQVAGKISKIEAKTSLYHLFSQHGPVIDVVVKKTESMRNQAFIVFRNVPAATAAMRALQGFPFFESALKIEYAKSKSNAISLLEGKVTPAPRKSGAKAEEEENADSSETLKRTRGDGIEEEEEEDNGPERNGTKEGDAKKLKTAAENGKQKASEAEEEEDMDMDQDDSDAEEEVATSKILFLTNLPPQITADGSDALVTLFKDYPGFKEVRLVPGKSNLAFVEYGNAGQAAEAKKRLHGFSIATGKVLKIEYSKV
ncbi:hypothetical protein CcCBS67573_g06123 [Chytriomyces confervae]|uniref:RRM domain-containing protein n=1 Tax=Chytriomyces confervae TaxID=246404 RepID=A0A507F671_9FUNG|nr:hypothetical protein CcCBS67573_g06123 [Chytriomyces confervae]